MNENSGGPDDALNKAFAPAHKRAMGLAVGATAAVTCFLVTAIPLLRGRPDGLTLELFSDLFTGYTYSWTGAVIGAVWSVFVGFAFGWFFAFVRNVLLALRLVTLRARAELAQTHDFMDQI